MKKLLLASVASTMLCSGAMADGHAVKVGVMLGYTGPAESYAPPMAGGAKAALNEASQSGAFLGGKKIMIVEADSGCDGQLGTTAAEKLVTADKVSGIIGGLCSGATTGALSNVAVANGIVMISPSATSPALSTLEDNGLFFRAAPSDANQGIVMADLLISQGVKSVAVTYTNNDYGKGLADAFDGAFKQKGGKVTINAPHEDGKGDYSAEVGALAAAGGERLVVVGYADDGGKGVIQAALDTGAFDTFHLPDAMVGHATEKNFGDQLDGSWGQVPGADAEGDAAQSFKSVYEAAGFDGSAPFSAESYDAAAALVLAMQAAGSSESKMYKNKVFDVVNAPGEKIYAGELKKGLMLLADGKDIDYVGATGFELIGEGDAAGSYRIIKTEGGTQKTVEYR